jgi:hypothetical protein
MSCGINKVDQLGEPLPKQQSVEFSQYVEVPCYTSLPRFDPTGLDFRLEKTDLALDLSSIHIQLSISITNHDGEKLPFSTIVAPINQIAYSMFSSVDLYISDQRVTINQINYPYIMYILNLLYTSDVEKKRTLHYAGWSGDTPGFFDILLFLTWPKKKRTARR